MASLHKVREKPGGPETWRLAFYMRTSTGKCRKMLRIGGVSKEAAEAVSHHVQVLCDCQKCGAPMPAETAMWLESIEDRMRLRLERLGLCRLQCDAIHETPPPCPSDITILPKDVAQILASTLGYTARIPVDAVMSLASILQHPRAGMWKSGAWYLCRVFDSNNLPRIRRLSTDFVTACMMLSVVRAQSAMKSFRDGYKRRPVSVMVYSDGRKGFQMTYHDPNDGREHKKRAPYILTRDTVVEFAKRYETIINEGGEQFAEREDALFAEMTTLATSLRMKKQRELSQLERQDSVAELKLTLTEELNGQQP